MTEEMNNFAPEVDAGVLSTKRLIEKNAMRHTFSRVGWAVFVLTLATGIVAYLLEELFSLFSKSHLDFISKNYLYFNEIVVALAVLAGFLVLMGLPASAPAKKKATAKEFFTYICICFAIGWIGNIIGTVMLTVWNAATGNEVVNQLSDILTMVGPWQMAICTGILAPILEELFFRKLIIDRTRRYGELASILISAFFFGIFHGNFSQFFYAFGIGAMLGYVYCKTGSYLTVVLLHMGFNFVMGVIPSLMTPDLMMFIEEYAKLTADNFDALVALVSEYAITIVGYLMLACVQGIFNLLGIILFIVNRKKIHIEKSDLLLSAKEQRLAAVLNAGVIAAFILLLLLTVSTLFTA